MLSSGMSKWLVKMPGAFHLRSLAGLSVVTLQCHAMQGLIYNLEHIHPQTA